jgi:hypothetical protein
VVEGVGPGSLVKRQFAQHPLPHAGHTQRELDVAHDLAGGLVGMAGLNHLFALRRDLEILHPFGSPGATSFRFIGPPLAGNKKRLSR